MTTRTATRRTRSRSRDSGRRTATAASIDRRLLPTRRPPIARSASWFCRAAMTLVDQVDREARTIPAVIATENMVTFYDWASSRVMQEVLLGSGATLFDWVPLLDSHDDWSLRSNLGSVLNSRRQGKTIVGTLQFAATPDVEPIWIRVRDGHLRAVSIGGRRLTWTDIEPGQSAEVAGRKWTAGKVPLRITTKWVQKETSVVIFGADGGAATAQ